MVALIDQLTKILMLHLLADGNVIYIIGDWFRFRLLFNPGAAFSFGSDSTWVFTCIQIIFLVGILLYSPRISDKWTAWGLALVAGGAAGNLTDRLLREPGFFFGHVVDFISIGNFAVFNIADSAITVGVVVYLIGAFLQEDSARNQVKTAPESSPGTSEAESGGAELSPTQPATQETKQATAQHAAPGEDAVPQASSSTPEQGQEDSHA